MSQQQAIDQLTVGGIIALPTETVYGLAVDAYNQQAIAALYQLKQRPLNKPLPIAIADAGQLCHYVTELSQGAQRLIDRWWPGPLTLVLAAKAEIAQAVGSQDQSIAVRCSSSPMLQSLLSQFKRPLCLSSANHSGQPPILKAQQFRNYFSDQIYLLVDDSCVMGLASTIVDARSERCAIVRQGAISAEQLGLSEGY